MELLKNAQLITGVYIALAVLLILVGLWRESIYRNESDAQQRELSSRQAKINEQQLELIRLVYKIHDTQSHNSQDISKMIAEMRREGTLSASSAKTIIENVTSNASSQTGVIDTVESPINK